MYVPGVLKHNDMVYIKVQRPAKIYIFLGVVGYSRSTIVARLSGWKSEGFSTLLSPDTVSFGVHQKASFKLPRLAYVFSKVVREKAVIPTKEYMKRNVKELKLTTHMHIRIAEANGAPSPPVGSFKGRTIKPNAACPNDLHDTWVAPHPDASVANSKFATWHPTWDPCFWCAYDHDHGSSPKHLMNYVPTFGYTAQKNNLEREPHPGFKGFVFKQDDYMVYYSIHAQTSDLRRVTLRFHTVTLAVTHAKTGELLAELTHKGDFGFLAARGRSEGLIPLRKEDVNMEHGQKGIKGGRRFRTVNVIGDRGRLDTRLRYRSDIMDGVYEAWTTALICSYTPAFSELAVDFETPGTGIRGASAVDIKRGVRLGIHGLNVGMSRNMHVRGVVIAGKYCGFGKQEGVFYTDAMGKKLLKKAGKGAVRQFIKKGFSMKMSGRFKVGEENWLGMFERDAKGFFVDHGYGIDPMKN